MLLGFQENDTCEDLGFSGTDVPYIPPKYYSTHYRTPLKGTLIFGSSISDMLLCNSYITPM